MFKKLLSAYFFNDNNKCSMVQRDRDVQHMASPDRFQLIDSGNLTNRAGYVSNGGEDDQVKRKKRKASDQCRMAKHRKNTSSKDVTYWDNVRS